MIPLFAALLSLGRAAQPVELGPAAVSAADIVGASLEDEAGPISISGPWRLVGTAGGVRSWQAPLPVRTRSLFFYKPPDDLMVYRRSREKEDWARARTLRHAPDLPGWSTKGTWSFTADSVVVRRPAEDGPPRPWEYAVRYSRALEREASLRVEAQTPAEAAAAFQSLQVDDSTREGFLLPAPASLTFQVTVPEGGVLDFGALIVPPEAADPQYRTDGARLRVTLLDEGQETALLDEPVALRRRKAHRASLAAWAGRTVSLRFESDPGERPDWDYVFITDPLVFTPTDRPRRMVMIFVDTLRRDHLSLYGYDRPTSPAIDAWAAQGAVFEQARTIAPWTLPSSRTMLLGADPEAWNAIPRLHRRLGEAGWATAYLAGNVYLSSNFGIAEGWSVHRCINWPQAWVQVDRAQAFLDEHPDRDAFLVLHLMDAHLPYREPWPWRSRFSGERPRALREDTFHRSDITRAGERLGEEGRQYVRDRYDNSIAYIDYALSGFLDGLGPDDTVILLADHGEEFWDHGGFEHGHTLYDELLRIPLIARGPGLPATRVDASVSLKDVAPTFAVAAGLSTEGMTGQPLQTLATAAPGASRPLAVGRPLYGTRMWGVLTADGQKYITHEGGQEAYNLAADPDEATDIFGQGSGGEPFWAAMAESLDRPVLPGLRILPAKSQGKTDLEVEVILPQGVAHAVVGDDPLMSSEVTLEICPDRVFATWHGGYPGTREVFIVPTGALGPALAGASIYLRAGDEVATATPNFGAEGPPPMAGKAPALFRGRVGKRAVALTYGIHPIPAADGTDLEGMDPELAAALAVLGYVAEDGSPQEGATTRAAPTSSRCP